MSQEAAKEMFWNLSLNTEKARNKNQSPIMKGIKIPLPVYDANKTKQRATVASQSTTMSKDKLNDVVNGQKMDLDTNFQLKNVSQHKQLGK